MTQDEMEILEYLKQNPDGFFSRKEISKRAKSREEFEENPQWAAAPLQSLLNQNLIVQNDSGAYKLKPEYEDTSRW